MYLISKGKDLIYKVIFSGSNFDISKGTNGKQIKRSNLRKITFLLPHRIFSLLYEAELIDTCDSLTTSHQIMG